MARFGSRYGELDEEIGSDNAASPGAMNSSPNNLSSMDTQEASKHLFGQVDWDEFLRAGVFLSQAEVRSSCYFFSHFHFLFCSFNY